MLNDFAGRTSLHARCFFNPAKYLLLGFILIAVLSGMITNSEAADKRTRTEDALLKNEKWTGDFDGMARDRVIRALVVYSRTFYFLDKAQQRGISYDLLKQFEKFANKKLKTKSLKFHVMFIPVQRDELIPSLVNGYGDIAVANLTITPERLKQVDFSDPLLSDVRELLVTGPSAPSIENIDGLAGKEIHARRSSSYYESLVKLNSSFKKAGKPEIKLVAVEEILEDLPRRTGRRPS